jgi:hypothetical protein
MLSFPRGRHAVQGGHLSDWALMSQLELETWHKGMAATYVEVKQQSSPHYSLHFVGPCLARKGGRKCVQDGRVTVKETGLVKLFKIFYFGTSVGTESC